MAQIEKIGQVFAEMIKDKVKECLETKFDMSDFPSVWQCTKSDDQLCFSPEFAECLRSAIDEVILDAYEASNERDFRYECIDSEADLWKNARSLLFGV